MDRVSQLFTEILKLVSKHTLFNIYLKLVAMLVSASIYFKNLLAEVRDVERSITVSPPFMLSLHTDTFRSRDFKLTYWDYCMPLQITCC